jgi:hypothetical protein
MYRKDRRRAYITREKGLDETIRSREKGTLWTHSLCSVEMKFETTKTVGTKGVGIQ